MLQLHSRQKKSSFPNTSHHLITIQSIAQSIIQFPSQITSLFMFSLCVFFGFELFQVTSEDGFADNTYTLLSVCLYICILSSLVKIIIEAKVGKVIGASTYSYLSRKVTLYPRQQFKKSKGSAKITSKSVVIFVKGCLKEGHFKDRRDHVRHSH